VPSAAALGRHTGSTTARKAPARPEFENRSAKRVTIAKIGGYACTCLWVEVRQPQARAPNPIDLRCQLLLHLQQRDLPQQAGDDETVSTTGETVHRLRSERAHGRGSVGWPSTRVSGNRHPGRDVVAHERARRRWQGRWRTRSRSSGRRGRVRQRCPYDADGQAQVVGIDYKAAQHGSLLSIRNTCAARAFPATTLTPGRRRRSCQTSSWFSKVRCSSWTITQTSARAWGCR